ncbi:MAG: hypothetical protein BWK79_00180 [Beggiatoa sp. IS2]|nr:MAG: hypothetical protein BWK78_00070 [Thiotrichaceae bacterium IS1]OQW96071.1 MAG: hypothetical protein BWK79_00180 [Beggiatoa sp. IS2]
MSSKIRFLLNNLLLDAILSATPEPEESLPVENILEYGSHLVMRSTSLTTQTITATWGATQVFDTVAIGQHNLTAGASVTVAFYATPGGTLVESFTPTIKPIMTAYPASVEARQMVVTVTDSANPKGYVQIGRVAAGVAFVPAFNMEYGLSLELVDTGSADRSRSGTKVIFAGMPYRKISMNFNHLDSGNRQVLQDFFLNQLGYTRSIFVSCYPNWVEAALEKDYEGFFHLSEQLRVAHDKRHKWAVNVGLEDSELVS